MRSFSKSIVCLLSVVWLCLPGECLASITAQFSVQSTSVVNGKDKNGNDAPHGLWIANDADNLLGNSDTGAQYFDILAGTLFTLFDDDTAKLTGSAVNPYGDKATFNLTFTGFADALPNGAADYKKEGGDDYNPLTQDFYENITGQIVFDPISSATDTTVEFGTYVDPHFLQFGPGANAKSESEFGASAWIREAGWTQGSGGDNMLADHWDLNLTLEAIPEPTTFFVWSLLGLSAIPTGRKLRR